MTGIYEWNPMPHRVSVRCPACGAHARFEFAEIVRIRRRADIPFFQRSRLFEYRFVQEQWHGQSWHGAIFFAGLHASGTGAIRKLPEGYAASDWDHSRHWIRRLTDVGSVACAACGLRRKHALRWPDDAWFRVERRGRVLWAFDRESALVLRDHVAATQRPMRGRRWVSFLRHVPKEFLVAKARAELVKRLDRLLAAEG